MTRALRSTLVAVALAIACRESSFPGAADVRTPAEALAVATPDSGPRADSLRHIEPGLLAAVETAPVSGWTGPGGRPFEVTVRTSNQPSVNARRFGTITLRNSARDRTGDLGQYPCSSCHRGRQVLRDERVGDAHQNIHIEHPKQTGAICATCHSADDVSLLALKNGERVSLDHTYRLCAQCHFSQTASWAGGAHGKRLDGWQGRRVVMGCADCHDPHRPAIGKRTPFRPPQLQRPTLPRR